MCFCLRVKMQIKSLRSNQRADPLLRSHLQKAATLWRVSTADRAPPVRPCMEQTRIIKDKKQRRKIPVASNKSAHLASQTVFSYL